MYLISACLCGVNCKYNGLNNYNEICDKLFTSGKAILVCPEQLGGLPTPRIPSEIIGESSNILNNNNGSVIDKNGNDVTPQFVKGAKETLQIAKKLNIKKAILKDGSPSCGVHYIYNGNFNGSKIKGMGITAQLLKESSIDIISELELGGNINGDI
ncbi:DUF523 domain-containing protein [uncultured Clostridium sp.]|uniref:DUF523 domain-containing protein n=1 Tax=uncultured Clostridium sp. TaxID=59620 RepID=UPI0025E356D7|nr:DUF523 domain-containing protein [uncultured Clostridium sp.]MDU4882282.1 DUF523 domain-containing protein [Clostridium celatum]MDU7075552.1 DUF523 domain-containing protein [Clostridium celatum]